MPQTARGQLISLAIEKDADQRFDKWKTIQPKVGQTIAQIAARFGNPEDSEAIRKENGVRSVNFALRLKKPKKKHGESAKDFKKRLQKWKKRQRFNRIRVPGNFSKENVLSVLAGPTPPTITNGYAKFSTINRPERTGIPSFSGYDPAEMKLSLWFESESVSPGGTKESYHDGGQSIEESCAKLERMAGRGQFTGAAVGPPPIVNVSTTGGSQSDVLPLIPLAYQRYDKNKSGPRWRVVGLEWDEGALRNIQGHRIRQLVTVTLWEHIELKLATRSATQRAKTRPKPKKRDTKRKAKKAKK